MCKNLEEKEEVKEKYYLSKEKVKKLKEEIELKKGKRYFEEQIKEKKGAKIVQAIITPDRLNKRQNGRRAKEDGEPSYTLTTQDKHGVIVIEKEEETSPKECLRVRVSGANYVLYIRRLTPKENWRLKCFTEEAYKKASEVSSETQLIKQAGNSIVVPILEEILKELYRKEKKCYQG